MSINVIKAYLATLRTLAALLTTFSVIAVIAPQRAQAVECVPPETGDFTLSSSCSFANTFNGVYKGDLILPPGKTLTVNSGQTLYWYPGKSIQLNGGSIAINANAMLKEANLVEKLLQNFGFDVYAAGQAARVYSNNLHVCTSEPCVISAPAGMGNLIVEGLLKIAGGSPGAGKVLTSDANGVASWQSAAGGGEWTTSGSTVYLTTGTNNVSIGTTVPGAKLEVVGPIKTWGSDIFAQNNNTTTTYSAAPIQIREAMYGASSSFLPPRLSFHWGGVIASQIAIESDGTIAIRDNPGTGYEKLKASTITLTGGSPGTGKVLTSDANGVASWQTGIPSGMIAAFDSTCPSGWTEYTAARGRYVVGVPAGGTIAGTDGAALTNLEDRPVGQHTHTINDPGHTHTVRPGSNVWHVYQSGGSGSHSDFLTTNINDNPTGSVAPDTGSKTTGITINNTGAVAGTNAPYIQLVWCKKN